MNRQMWKSIGKCFVIVSATYLLVAFTFKELWNYLLPSIFNLPAITFWQGLGLLLLTKIILSPIFPFQNKRNAKKNNCVSKEKWNKKISALTPEERENFKNNLFNKCKW